MPTFTAPLRWLIAASCFALLPACGGSGSGRPLPASYVLQNLAVGENRVIAEESLGIEMTGVSDSRCPAAATCITAGFAAVDLVVRLEGVGTHAITATLGAGAHDGQAAFGGFQFTLARLDPYPVSGPFPAGQYRADITVSRR